jgi:transposase
VRSASVWQRVLGLVHTVIEEIDFDEDREVLEVRVRPRKGARRRCGRCARRGPWYDRGDGERRWRGLDLGTLQVHLVADGDRVNCPVHGPTVVQFPWARHGARHSRDFEDTVAWLAVHTSKSAVVQFLRMGWRAVGTVIGRVSAEREATVDRFANLRRIGIDEISYKRGFKYLTAVVDHDSGRLVWAGVGRTDATLHGFFDLLGDEGCAQITHVSADSADWIERVVATRCAHAVMCADPFHVVKWANDALEQLRRQRWNEARGGQNRSGSDRRRGRHPTVHPLKKVKYALVKNPENLTGKQHRQLEWVMKTDEQLWRAYLLKEGLRHVFELGGEEGKEALDHWISWARRCRIPVFVELARKVVRHRAAIDAALDHGLSNALSESTNTKIRLLTRVAFGFHSADALIGLAMLALGGLCPPLPGRA